MRKKKKENQNLPIGPVLKKLRLIHQLSQEDVAEICNIDRRYVSRLENNQNSPGFSLFIKLATAFQMEPEELMKMIKDNVDLSSEINPAKETLDNIIKHRKEKRDKQ